MSEVERDDLSTWYTTLTEKLPKKNEAASTTSTATKKQRGRAAKNKVLDKPSANSETNKVGDKIDQIATQVDEMHAMMKSAVSSTKFDDPLIKTPFSTTLYPGCSEPGLQQEQ